MSSAALMQIDKLDGHNYDSWCTQMKSILIHTELWKIVSGKFVRNIAVADKWDELDEKALATITLGVKTSQLMHIRKCKSSLEAWKALETLYKATGPVRKVSLYRKLINMKMEENDDILKYLNDFSNVADKLAEMDIALPDEVLVIMLLSNLPKSFDNFVVAMETRDNLPSFSFVNSKIIEEGERKRGESGESSGIHVYAQVNASRNNNNSKGNRELKCYACGRPGHFASKCKAKKKHGDREQKSYTMLAATNISFFNSSEWCVDSGATAHMCSDRKMFTKFQERRERVTLAGSNYMYAEGIGEVLLTTNEGDVLLIDALYVPELGGNFISVSKIIQRGFVVKFAHEHAIVCDNIGRIILKAKQSGGLFVISKANNKCFYINGDNCEKWHARYGHLNYGSLQELASKKMVHGLEDVRFPKFMNCTTCMKCKIYTQPFPQKVSERAKGLLDVIHTDVCGPFRTTSLGGAKYYISFIDDKSRRVFIYFIKSKDEAFDKFVTFKNLVERQTERKIKCMRSDNGLEFVNKRFDNLFKECGIKRQLTVPYSPQQNGVAERMNRTIVEMARTMMAYANIPEMLWAEAIATAVYIRNRSPTKALTGMTPYEVWTGRKPSIKHLRVFGSIAVCLDKTQSNKLQAKGKELKMVGYSLTSKAYRLYDPERDVMFSEIVKGEENSVRDLVNYTQKSFIFDQSLDERDAKEDVVSNQKRNREDDDTDDDYVGNEAEFEEEEQVRFGRGRPRFVRTGMRGRPKKARHLLNVIESSTNIDIPQTVAEALNCRYAKEWENAIREEHAALIKNKTWSLENLPEGQRAIGCRWVFSVKRQVDGAIERFKCRLVAKGCNQQLGVNYKETFSPVIRYSSIRMVLALAVEWKLYVHQMDVCTAYLNSDLHDIVYMKQP
uniref:Retrovirus-related Pol polyprotein from transposon TNT 1-94 n=1 Tax=Bactrocera latifrons TaxID=174628 RepID=A0A0K8UDK8_BACLA